MSALEGTLAGIRVRRRGQFRRCGPRHIAGAGCVGGVLGLELIHGRAGGLDLVDLARVRRKSGLGVDTVSIHRDQT